MYSHEPFRQMALQLRPLTTRESRVRLSDLLVPTETAPALSGEPEQEVAELAAQIVAARACFQPVIFFIGGHVIKSGLGLYLRELIQQGYVTTLASNGAATIHDYELAHHGATSETVAKEIRDGQFGMWQDDTALNQIHTADTMRRGLGWTFGEHLWRLQDSGQLAHPEVSVFLSAYEQKIPATVHLLIGGDITHMYAGRQMSHVMNASYHDFLVFVQNIDLLQRHGGVFVCLGSAVHAPEIFLKALSMSRNLLRQESKQPHTCTTAIMDMYPLPDNWRAGEPDQQDPRYYFRPWKTILMRSLTEGGRSYYVRGNHQSTLPRLYHWIKHFEKQRDQA